ncbi:MAG: putative phosphosugar isomerase [Nitrososphaeraceae archaeon]|nr:putative phosphosugar isomerase [Nitrososphaeraceae archaeon]
MELFITEMKRKAYRKFLDALENAALVAAYKLGESCYRVQNMSQPKSVEAMEHEIDSQSTLLLKLELPERVDPTKCVMTGSGDSYVAASIASYLSNRRTVCCFPSELILNNDILEGKELYVVSISGRTAQNIAAAKAAKKRNIKTTAITANSYSELARLCDRVVRVDYSDSGVPTSGSISFLSTLLACVSLVTRITVSPKDLQGALEVAKTTVNSILDQISDTPSSILYLAEGPLYPIAWYGSLKMNEVLGVRSFPYSTQEYCHAPLFSIKKDDTIIILNEICSEATPENEFLQKLRKLNFPVLSLNLPVSPGISCLLQAVFSVQLLALRKAKKKGMTDCFFAQSRDLLNASSACIY